MLPTRRYPLKLFVLAVTAVGFPQTALAWEEVCRSSYWMSHGEAPAPRILKISPNDRQVCGYPPSRLLRVNLEKAETYPFEMEPDAWYLVSEYAEAENTYRPRRVVRGKTKPGDLNQRLEVQEKLKTTYSATTQCHSLPKLAADANYLLVPQKNDDRTALIQTTTRPASDPEPPEVSKIRQEEMNACDDYGLFIPEMTPPESSVRKYEWRVLDSANERVEEGSGREPHVLALKDSDGRFRPVGNDRSNAAYRVGETYTFEIATIDWRGRRSEPTSRTFRFEARKGDDDSILGTVLFMGGILVIPALLAVGLLAGLGLGVVWVIRTLRN